MRTLHLKRLTGDWNPYNLFNPDRRSQFHFGPNHIIDVALDRVSEPLRAQILDEIEKGVIVDQHNKNPFARDKPVEEQPTFTVESCFLSEEWPCQYAVHGSCPVPCIHDQTPPEEKEEDDTGYTCTDCGGTVREEDTVCRHCGEAFDANEDEAVTPAEPPKGTVDTPLTPLGKILASLPRDFDEAMERIGELSYNDVRDFARQDGINVKASGKKTEIVKRIRDRLFEVWGE